MTRCALYGGQYEFEGYVANTACCTCGGGLIANESNQFGLSFPSLSPSQSQMPTVITCVNWPNWFAEEDGYAYTCNWYADQDSESEDNYSRCEVWGNDTNADGINAFEACCACDGVS